MIPGQKFLGKQNMGKSSGKNDPQIYYTHLVGTIDDGTVKHVIEELSIANAKEYIEEIRLYLSTYGGDLLYAFALYDHIQSSPKPVDIVAEGVCMSAGVMILQAARRRYATEHTLFMVHPSITNVEEKSYQEMLQIVDQYKKNHELFIRLSIDRSGIDKEEFEKIYTPRKYLSASEACSFGKYGLVDQVLENSTSF
ncbi:ATP-dependent Clp protease proteolytic subunit [Candidatus Microgenomates bacterium]|nr:ATP-dependent Clp protease proteolytic subunit [Candidatus Microgenomates bacterium]